jgi:hypothetical protein
MKIKLTDGGEYPTSVHRQRSSCPPNRKQPTKMKAITYNTVRKIEALRDAIATLRTAFLCSPVGYDEHPALCQAIEDVYHIEPTLISTEDRTGRVTDLCAFTHILSDVLHTQYPTARVYRIESPEKRGDVTVVLQGLGDHLQAITYTAAGVWTSPSYWCEGQI